MVKSYQMLNKYKNWNTRKTYPPADGVEFYQKGAKNNNNKNNYNWEKRAICHECGKKGHIRPNFPNTMMEKDNDE